MQTLLHRRGLAAVLITVLAATSACEQVEQVQDHFRDMTPHEAYEESLRLAGLDSTALGAAWREAADEALSTPMVISLPFQEQGYIAPEEPGAIGYRVSVPRGRKLTAEVMLDSDEGTRVFVDFFRVAADEDDPARPLISTDSIPGAFEHEPWRAGDFILRLQPELLRGGAFTVTLRLEAQLAFPVQDHGVPAVQSRFGVPREGGRRAHHGVDIFAPRGTPVLAAAEGTVNRVELTNLGGKVVWLRDPVRSANLYYAHLDSQAVRSGQRVRPGDTIGFVGNTGNAITTPPHLHFGMYRRGEGPVDPFPFLEPPRGELPELTADVTLLGSWVRVLGDGIYLREEPGRRGAVLAELEEHTPARVLASAGEYFRVRLPDGGRGYVAARLTEPLDEPVAAEAMIRPADIRAAPGENAAVVATLSAGEEVPVLGRFGSYLFVRSPTGRDGWVGVDQD
jgi:murein DD-endopeptidase MepM/ murein hydrolase activator NlpD